MARFAVTPDVAVRLAVLYLVAYLCFFVISPFLDILLWGIILAVALLAAWVVASGRRSSVNRALRLGSDCLPDWRPGCRRLGCT